MAKLNRIPLQVSPKFKKRLDEIQRKIMIAQGEKKSLRELTENIISSPLFEDIERNLIKAGDLKMDIKLKLDRRFLDE